MADNKITVKTDLTEDGRVIQTLDMAGEVSKHVANVAAMQREAAFREQLIRMGWVPPEGDAKRNTYCSYTGAVVLIQDYNCVVVGDLFAVGDTHTLIQWNAEQETWLNGGKPYLGRDVTHVVLSTNDGYHHKKRGVTVVNNALVQTTEHARK